MQVKCRWCGKKIDKKDAFCSPTGSGRFYFCNEEEANAKELEKAKKAEKKNKPKKIDPVYEEIAAIFGYRIQNSALFKEIKLWRSICGDEKILAYLQENKDYIKNAVERLNSNEYARIRYVSAILKNSLKDYQVNKKEEPIKPIITEPTEDNDYIMPINRKRKKERRKGFGE